MSNQERLTITPQLAVGVFIMLFGVALTLDRLGVMATGRTMSLWPLVLVALGVWVVRQRNERRSRVWGYILVFVGAWMLLRNLGIISVGFFQLFWPLVVVWVGVTLVMH